jgi:hypothetical protein
MSMCFDGPCKPWTKLGCRSCAVRPFKIYQGNGNSRNDRAYCRENGIGMMVSPGGCTAPQNFSYFAVDNGAFSSWKNGLDWDGDKFLSYLSRMLSRGTPDFVVTPDKVAKGLESLEFSNEWATKLHKQFSGIRLFLAVQDGMEVEDIGKSIVLYDGIFVGGTLEWKYQTAEQWVEFAHSRGRPCHIGRVGTWDKIVWAMRIGADSIDSSSWAQNDSWHHIEAAKAQERLEVM